MPDTAQKAQAVLYALSDLLAGGEELTFRGGDGPGQIIIHRKDGAHIHVGADSPQSDDSLPVLVDALYDLFSHKSSLSWVRSPLSLSHIQPFAGPLFVCRLDEIQSVRKVMKLAKETHHGEQRGAVLDPGHVLPESTRRLQLRGR